MKLKNGMPIDIEIDTNGQYLSRRLAKLFINSCNRYFKRNHIHQDTRKDQIDADARAGLARKQKREADESDTNP